MNERPLKLGTAYHGVRAPSRVREDMADIVKGGMNLAVHTFSHTDWERHKPNMQKIVEISEEAGLEVWIDAWGLGGPPGDKSHFLAYYPDSRAYFSDGSPTPVNACLNAPDFRRFVKDWIDAVYEIGGRTIFWDEPCAPAKIENGLRRYSCACPRCKKLFEEKYSEPAPEFSTPSADAFVTSTIIDYFADVTAYSASRGMKNVVCVMLESYGMNLELADKICVLPHIDNVGSDPYWIGEKSKNPGLNVYGYVYERALKNVEICNRFNKDCNVWIQTHANPRGAEEDIVSAYEAAYDAGARNIVSWSYYGGESNDYAAENPALVWAKTREGVRRVRDMERNAVLAENRKLYMK